MHPFCGPHSLYKGNRCVVLSSPSFIIWWSSVGLEVSCLIGTWGSSAYPFSPSTLSKVVIKYLHEWYNHVCQQYYFDFFYIICKRFMLHNISNKRESCKSSSETLLDVLMGIKLSFLEIITSPSLFFFSLKPGVEWDCMERHFSAATIHELCIWPVTFISQQRLKT